MGDAPAAGAPSEWSAAAWPSHDPVMVVCVRVAGWSIITSASTLGPIQSPLRAQHGTTHKDTNGCWGCIAYRSGGGMTAGHFQDVPTIDVGSLDYQVTNTSPPPNRRNEGGKPGPGARAG